MDEQLHDIDDLFQNAVQRHSALPTDNVWEHLEKNLQKRNVTSITKQYKKWKWAAAVLFIFFISLATYTLQLNWRYKNVIKEKHPNVTHLNSTKNSHNNPDSSRHALNQKAAGSSLTEGTGSQVELKGGSKEHRTATGSKNVDNKTLINETSAIEIAGEIIHKNKKKTPITGFLNTHSARHPPGQENKSRELNSGIAINKRKAKALQEATEKTGNETLQNNISTIDDKSGLPPGTPLPGRAYPGDDSAGKESMGLKASLVRAPLDLRTLKPSVIPYSNVNGLTAKKSIRLKTKSLHTEKFTAGIFYSEHIISTSLEANRPDFREDNYLQIKTHEKNRISGIIGLMISGKITGNLGIVSGISLATYTTDITRKPLVARKDNNGKINYRISTSSGYAYYTVKNRPQPPLADSIQTLSSKSTVKYISVPIGLQYNLYVGRFGFTPAVLVYANFKSTGKITTIQSLEHTYTGNIEGLKSHYFDGNIGLGMDYYLNKRIAISLIPSVRLALSAATEKNPVTAERNSVGLAAGLNFSF